jgi:leucyl-tRNA synthetase
MDLVWQYTKSRIQVLRLFNQKEWCEEMAKNADELRTGVLNAFQDALFNNEMNVLVHESRKHYEATNYKLAIKVSFYDFAAARDFYREACAAAGIKMHKDLVFRYMELQALIIAIVAPHWADYIWTETLQKGKSIQFARWPEVPAGDPGLTAARDYVRAVSSNANSAESVQLKRKAKGKEAAFDTSKPKKLTIFVATKFPAWQAQYMDLLREVWDESTNRSKIDDRELNARVGKMGGVGGKKAMPFVQSLKRRLQSGEKASVVLDAKLPFDEGKTLVSMVPGLKRTAGLAAAQIVAVEEGSKKGRDLTDEGREVDLAAPQAENAVPLQPTFFFENVAA